MNLDRFSEGPRAIRHSPECDWCDCGEAASEYRDGEPMCEDCAEKLDAQREKDKERDAETISVTPPTNTANESTNTDCQTAAAHT